MWEQPSEHKCCGEFHPMACLRWHEENLCLASWWHALRACVMSSLRRKDAPPSHKICIKSSFCHGRGATNLTPQIRGLDWKSFGSVEDIYLIYYLCSPALVNQIRALAHRSRTLCKLSHLIRNPGMSGKSCTREVCWLFSVRYALNATAMQAYLLTRRTTEQRAPNAKDSLLCFWLSAPSF